MALDTGALPTALTNTVARVDFNAAMAQLDAAFPLTKFNLGGDSVVTIKIKDLNVTTAKIALLAITAALLGPQSVETAKIKLLNITAALLGPQAVETDKIKLLNITAALLGPQSVETDKIKLLNITAALLGPQAVETAKIKLLNITEALLGPLAVTAAKLQTDAVETIKIKALNVTKAKAELGFGRYVPLPSNAWTYQVGDLTTNGAWQINALDFTALVPAGATGIVLRIEVVDDAASSRFQLRHDAAFGVSLAQIYTQVANISVSVIAVLPIESDRLMDYWGSNLAFTGISIAPIGYFM